uniref:Cilia- and flagella-associated protein 126 n=1 Tax=Trichobilharzia regenti TaxID=157069 RepID=A0AA85JZP3_TRIRE|nr:unnamed protein product [Trichobilharzia regenti]
MSQSFSANQYEEPFYPEHLQLYGPAKKFRERPRAKTRTTHFIASDNGHLLKGQDTKPGDCPWGHYVGTWDLPCHYPGNYINNPTSRTAEAFKKLQKEKESYQAKLNLAKANKSYSVAERAFWKMYYKPEKIYYSYAQKGK